ncbi:MAG: glycosyltransferase family 2 protein [Ardenticatenaceae bacterium]|nr:glycosyltransferase family 2 protein [Ardenticatenaceae bacterium]MCB9446238.1 glycosyltransferase family 2 protein [Ardenticatenaceae bacterium]
MLTTSIIIPHLNGRHHLDDCFNSLRQQTWRDFEILLVDNGSTDGTQDYVRQQYPEVKLLELGQNRGFTGACNAGWQVASGKYIILLNNDTEVDANWLAEIVSAFERRPNVGIVASKMLLFDKRNHFHTAGDFYRLDGIPGNRGVWQEDVGQYDVEEEVFGACGGSSAYRRALLDEIGFLDDDFFFSCEDVDISWRAHLAGWKVLYVPTAVVYHKLKATGGAVTGSYYDGRNFLYLIWKNYPSSLLRQNWPLVLKAQLKITKEALRQWRGEAARARLRGQLAGLLGLFKMLPKRRRIQANRRIDDDSLTAVLTPVDDPPQGR